MWIYFERYIEYGKAVSLADYVGKYMTYWKSENDLES